MNYYLAQAQTFLKESDSDAVAIAIIDFKRSNFKCIELYPEIDLYNVNKGDIYFDLASLTKPLVNGFSFMANQIDNHQLDLLVNHRAGIPAWGLLQKNEWKEQILHYPIEETHTIYSDYSALRYMLEFEKATGRKLEDEYKKYLSEGIIFLERA